MTQPNLRSNPSFGRILQEAYYKAVPAPIRSFLRGKDRDVVFASAMEILLQNPSACAFPGNPVLLDLIYGWGNEAWSARDEYLAACISHASSASGAILECGAGLSSIVLAAVAKQHCITHWVLEHKPEWANKVQGYLNEYGLTSIIQTNPLKDYGDFCWYDVNLKIMPTEFHLVVCDGPPRRTKGGRYGLIPIMKSKLNSGATILLDDGGRKEELDIAERWKTELACSFTLEGLVKPYIRMELP